ncbi:hypothetical protein CRV24_001833 [Beauveria bassiana]|nr:hypothetical protein CRV24_001833 [Beauveria bassiana]
MSPSGLTSRLSLSTELRPELLLPAEDAGRFSSPSPRLRSRSGLRCAIHSSIVVTGPPSTSTCEPSPGRPSIVP